MFLFSHLLLMIGMMSWGWSLKGNAQYRRLARLLFATVVFTLALFVGGEWMANHSDESFWWELAAGFAYWPAGLCWIGIGMTSLRVCSKSR
ncbi:hypothetical protein [Cohnella panacarvi]|uniref:hypothetical protein n=1 Tax=Cohnella panacarvi TaxID=400776 RepID=UPI00047C541F|nr:hypothetical protein [Cohnella panacarvi]